MTGPLTPDDILAALDPEQHAVASEPSGPMVVVAGAGTGKTRALTHRIAYAVATGVQQPQRVLALTFTARAAGAMRTRLRGLGVVGVQARTFHAAALRQLHYFWPQAIGGPAPEVMPHKAGAVAEALGRLRIQADRTAVRDVASEIEWAKVGLVSPEGYAAAARAARREPPAGLDGTAMARVLTVYGEVTSGRGVIDFEDVLLVLLGILRDRDDIARAVREQYRHFVVDEYQDVNPLQHALLQAWLGDRRDLCVVGDPAQTIYSFAGASATHLLRFTTDHPGAHTVRLVRNYRSTPEIVRVANALLTSPGGARRSGSVELQATRPAGVSPTVTTHPDDPAEARAVAHAIRAVLDGGAPAAEVAVLFRTNGQSELVETALADLDIPYLVRGGERFFHRREVREAILLLRGAARSDDGSVPLPDLVRDVLVGAGWSHQPPTSGGAARERWESLTALAALADDLAAGGKGVRLPDVVRELDERAASQHAPEVQGVTLASLHAAKGLEWDHVFLIGCSDGLLPISLAETAEAIEEERRLLYVGVTRARTRLSISWAGTRTPGGRATRRPSRFLEPAAGLLGPDATVSGERSGGGGGRRRGAKGGKAAARRPTCRSCGADLASAAERTVGRCSSCPATYDEEMFERLREWRSAIASRDRVPAYVVFTDATLTAIAEQAPTSQGQLAAIRGVGARKLELYAADVLTIVDGGVVEVTEKPSPTA
jgi:DNA helicase-2/ATP-dependent DNA helicase PcrA